MKKIKLLLFITFRIFIKHFKFVCLFIFLIFTFIFLTSLNSNSFFQNWSKMTYYDFGFVKRLLVPSIFSFFNLSLLDYLSLYKAAISFSLISFCTFVFLNNYLFIIKKQNYLLLFLLFFIFFLSPNSILRLNIFHDGFSFSIFILSLSLIVKKINYFRIISITFLSLIAVLNHETYLAFFVPVLFIITKFQKASLKQLSIFMVPMILVTLLLLFYGRTEGFKSLEAIESFANSLDIYGFFIPNKNFCNFYYGMPFYVNMSNNLQFTKCIYINYHRHSFEFYLVLCYFFLLLYFFFDFLKRNHLSLFWNFLAILPNFIVFFIACDVGRWIAFSVLNMGSIIFYWSLKRKIYFNKYVYFLILATFFLGQFDDWYGFSYSMIRRALNHIVVSTPFLNDLYNMIF